MIPSHWTTRVAVCLTFVFGASAASAARYETISGLKYPNEVSEEGTVPVLTKALTTNTYTGFNALLPFIMPSPDQEDAGSCLYMALTGIAEWWLARLSPTTRRDPSGPLNLSERYLMNLAGLEESGNGVPNWKTDSIYLYNLAGHGMRNDAYRYTKGWYRETEAGYTRAEENAEGAKYGTPFNWIDARDEAENDGRAPLPRFQRNVIFADPTSNQWNVDVTPADIIDRVKSALRRYRAPILVVYNHYAYWHAVMIVGFDDDGDSQGCEFTAGTAPYLAQLARDLFAEAAQASNPTERAALLARARRNEGLSHKLSTAWQREGGCRGRGVFYVRDSLYQDPQGPVYDYDLSRTGEESPYGRKVIVREYEWLKHLGNHITQISAESGDIGAGSPE